jgi:hypothetical protein
LRTDTIEAIGIDASGSLWVKPAVEAFPHIYREAMEVHWDAQRLCLYSPKPREWSYEAWFQQITEAARQQGVELKIDQSTVWLGIQPALQQAMTSMLPD